MNEYERIAQVNQSQQSGLFIDHRNQIDNFLLNTLLWKDQVFRIQIPYRNQLIGQPDPKNPNYQTILKLSRFNSIIDED